MLVQPGLSDLFGNHIVGFPKRQLKYLLFMLLKSRDKCLSSPRSRGYKTFFMLSSTETKIYPAHKRYNSNNNFQIHLQNKLLALMILPQNLHNFDYFSIHEQLKFHAQMCCA